MRLLSESEPGDGRYFLTYDPSAMMHFDSSLAR